MKIENKKDKILSVKFEFSIFNPFENFVTKSNE